MDPLSVGSHNLFMYIYTNFLITNIPVATRTGPTSPLVVSQIRGHTINTLQQTLIHITTRKFIDRPIRTRDMRPFQRDIRTRRVGRALDIPTDTAVLATRSPDHILHQHVANGEVGGEGVAERDVLLSVALGDFDGVVGVGDVHGVVGDVVDAARAAAALQVA